MRVCSSMTRSGNCIQHFVFSIVQRAKKENDKMREELEKQRLAKEREVWLLWCYWTLPFDFLLDFVYI